MATDDDRQETRPTLLERLSAFLTREPEDREELLELLHGAFERKLLDADALSMIEGVMSVSEMTVRDIMIPRAQMDVVSLEDEPAEFIPLVLETRHSRFPVIGENKDDVVGILLAKEDRKSTRLNSSHVSISYAVFCLKKKTACACVDRLTTS